MLDSVPHQWKLFAAGEIYASVGDPYERADIIVQGELVARMLGASGKLVEVTHLRTGNVIAPAFIFAKDHQLPVEVTVHTDVVVLRFAKRDFARLINDNEQVRWNFIGLLSNTNAFLTRKLHTLSLLTVKEKLANMLLQQMHSQGSREIVLPYSRQEIADIFGIQKFSVIRQLAAFEQAGAIVVRGKLITIVDPKQLTT